MITAHHARGKGGGRRGGRERPLQERQVARGYMTAHWVVRHSRASWLPGHGFVGNTIGSVKAQIVFADALEQNGDECGASRAGLRESAEELRWHRRKETEIGSSISFPVSARFTFWLVSQDGTDCGLSQAVYSALFDWLVAAVNKKSCGAASRSQSSVARFIGVLDIFGFEVRGDVLICSLCRLVLVVEGRSCSEGKRSV
eukprot:6171869-Pleurochrysis_carterae.AAC.3